MNRNEMALKGDHSNTAVWLCECATCVCAAGKTTSPKKRTQSWDLNSYNSSGRKKSLLSGFNSIKPYESAFFWCSRSSVIKKKKKGTECVGCFSGSWSLTLAGKQMDALILRRRNNINTLWISFISFGRIFFYFQVIEVWAHSREGFQLIQHPFPTPTTTTLTQPLITFIPLDFGVNASCRWAWVCFFTFWKALLTGSDHQRGPLCQIRTNIIN